MKELESSFHAQEYESLDNLLSQFWELDSIGLADTDNGTNLVGANNELLALLDQEKIKNNMANKGIKWKFNPPRPSAVILKMNPFSPQTIPFMDNVVGS